MVDKSLSAAWRSPQALAALVVLVTVVAYLPVRNAGFVFDDYQNVTGNQSLRTLPGLKGIWTDLQASFQYYPLTYSSFWIEYHLWGLRPAGYHVVNVLLHAVNAVLVGLLLSRLAVPGAWLAAFLFALHPVHVESVAWVSERKNVLSGVFYLCSLLTYLRIHEATSHRWRFYALSLALFVCALLSKTSAASMPFAVLLLLWWKQGRIKWQDVLALVPFVLAGAVLGLLTAWVEVQYSGAQGPEWEMSWLERVLVAGRVVWFYAGKLIWPYPLMIIYPRWQVDSSVWWQYLFPGAAGAVVLALWWWRERLGKAPLVGVVFFAASLAPIPALINIGFMRYSYVADHWQYLSSIGLIALAAATGEWIWRRMEKRRRYFAAVAGAAVLMVLATATCRRAHVYADSETLWQDNVAKNPNAWLAQNNLGLAQWQSGKVQEAIKHYEQALRINPYYAEAHHNLGLALAQTGELQEAIKHFGEVARIKPDSAEAHRRLGMVLQQTGYLQEAAAQFKQALRMKPDSAETYNNLGNAALQTGRFKQAVKQYEQALRLNPNIADVQNNLAWLLATLAPAEGGDPVRAVTLAQQACELTDNRVAAYLDTQAAAYAAAGRFNDATVTALKAVELARSDGQPQLAREIESRLELYRSGRVCRQPGDTSRP